MICVWSQQAHNYFISQPKQPEEIMIKAIIFDIGGVLLRTHDHSYRHQWDNELEVPLGTVEHTVFNSAIGKAAQLGEVTTAVLWQRVGEIFALSSAQLSQLKYDFWAGDVLDLSLVALIRNLHRTYKTAVISNYSDILPHLINDEWGMKNDFDLLTVSAHEHIMKPDPQIYKTTLQKLNLSPEQTVFIDDFAHNIKGAKDVGMHGIHFTEGVILQDELTKLGIQIDE